MTIEQAEKDPDWKAFKLMFTLRNMIEYHSRLYYVEDAPVITDAEFDLLYKKLETLEKLHPNLVTEDSPTKRVGGYASKSFKKIKHGVPMLSLDKVHTEDEFLAWDAKLKKILRND